MYSNTEHKYNVTSHWHYRVANWTSMTAFLALFDANFFTNPGSTMHTRTESTPSSSAVTEVMKANTKNYNFTHLFKNSALNKRTN